MNNIKYCSFPGTPKAALAELLDRKREAVAVAGGTLTAKTLPETAVNFVDLKNLPLSYIRRSGPDLVIGATATFDEIDNSNSPNRAMLSAAAARFKPAYQEHGHHRRNIAGPILSISSRPYCSAWTLRLKYSVEPALRPAHQPIFTARILNSAPAATA